MARSEHTVLSDKLTVGILAHVDAGKTTLSEGILYFSGILKRVGRVDHGDAFLDNNEIERARGITVYSKPARFSLRDFKITLLDTPGHADFSPEMERALSVLDYAILLVSAPEGVNARVQVLWKLLAHYHVPAFVFVNKMDKAGIERSRILAELQGKLNSGIIDFTDGVESEDRQEEIAVLDDDLTERWLAGEGVTDEMCAALIADRRLFPAVFGSALKLTGVERLLEVLGTYLRKRPYPEETFAARVFKITRDGAERLTWLKLTGGKLAVRDAVDGEKITGIRQYSGVKYESVPEVCAGDICAVTGLSKTAAGKGLGGETDGGEALLLPVIRRKLLLPEGTDLHHAFSRLKWLEEEEPMLQVSCEEETKEIYLGIMGEVQTEILKKEIAERLSLDVGFGEGTIIYRETILSSVEGVGHFEPLRHYAEVHVRLSPLPPGSGIVVDADCRTDLLKENFQRLAVSNLLSKCHRGVLTGSELTDVRITLIGGKSHEKHTEGGDFRKASIRAVRQGLMSAENILLEPIWSFTIGVPRETLGLVLNDLESMHARPDGPVFSEDATTITGTCPVSTFGDYALHVRACTGGRGSVVVTPGGYEPCHNAEEVILSRGYDPDADLRNPSSSVFCSHGAGLVVPWYEVRSRMHVDTGWTPSPEETPLYTGLRGFQFAPGEAIRDAVVKETPEPSSRDIRERERRIQSAEDELMAIFERTYGKLRLRGEEDEEENRRRKRDYDQPAVRRRTPKKASDERSYLLIDGYNMIYANAELKALAELDAGAARDALIDVVSNAQGFSDETMILVFDAYRVPSGRERLYTVNGLSVIFTREAETADQYIERAAREIGKKYRVRVATSDGVEQIIIFGAGALRLPASGFWEEMADMGRRIREAIEHGQK